MKKIILLLVVALLGIGMASAEKKAQPQKALATIVITTDIDCPHCAKKVTDNIPFEKGVKDVKCDVASKTITITYDTNKTTKQNLIVAVNKLRIQTIKAEDVK